MAKLILAGGGNEIQSKNTDLKFLELIDKTKPILYIPLAMPLERYSYQQDLAWIQNSFKSLNFSNIELGTDLKNLGDLDNFSAVYIGGGNTYLLADFFHKNNFFEELDDFVKLDNGIVYGGSAGAIILGDDIRSSNDSNNVGIQNYEGFNFIKGFSILPHWTPEKESRIHNLYNLEINRIICIPEDSSLIYDTNLKLGKVVGKIRIYNESEVQEFPDGHEIQF